jgi:hypothetical protein
MLKLALIERLDLANRIHGKCVRVRMVQGEKLERNNCGDLRNRNNQLFTQTHLYNAN